jgi:phosphoenolpyruvate mutase
MAIIQKAASLGELTIGMLSDEAIVSFKRFPILNYTERVKLVEAIKGVHTVVQQATLSYAENLRKYKPDIVVHGDNWKSGPQKAIRDEVIEILKEYGGELVETAYADNPAYEAFEAEQRKILSMPDQRRGRLKKLLEMKPLVSIMEAHSGITGLIVEKTIVTEEGKTHQFDGMWSSSLCDSTSKGKPDIELLDMSTRFKTLDEIMDVTTKPIIVDGDTGGQTEHFVYNIRTMERMGVSAVIIEDKTGLKKNSLFGTDVEQTQDSIENFSAKLKAGRAALKSNDFLLIARIESLILDKGMEDALERAFAFTKAGAHGIMIHSRKKDPSEIFEFCDKFRAIDKTSPLVVVPTSFNSVTEEEFAARGVNIVIYANQFTRSGFPAMKHVAETILSTHRAKEADDLCMSIKEILTLIPEEF